MKNEDIEKIKKWLPRGYGKMVQEKTGKSLSLIYGVVSGRCESAEITEVLIQMAMKNKEKKENQEKLVATL